MQENYGDFREHAARLCPRKNCCQEEQKPKVYSLDSGEEISVFSSSEKTSNFLIVAGPLDEAKYIPRKNKIIMWHDFHTEGNQILYLIE